MNTTVLKAEDRITKNRVTIMRDPRFIAIAGILMIGSWSVSETMPTACTNGKNVIYGRKFVDGLTDQELRFVILHEYYHIMFMHLVMWRHLWDQNPQLANIAADMVINLSLDDAAGKAADGFLHMPSMGVQPDPKYRGWDTGEVFRDMLKNGPPQGGKGKGKGQPGQGQPGQGEGFDEHDLSGQGDDGELLTQEEINQLRQEIDSALRQGAQLAGKVGGNLDRSLTGLLEVQVPWQEVLQEFVRSHCQGNDLSTWRRPSRRWMSREIMQPSHYAESAKRITIGVDTSGSIGESQLRRALTEIKGACDSVHPEIVDVIYWDSQVAGHETYEGDAVSTIVDATKPAGGGGTRVGAMLDYMKAKDIRPDCVIVFTDGYVESDWGGNNWPAPVLWCVSTKGIVAPFGKTLYVPAE